MKGPNCVPKAHSSTFLKFKIPKILNIRNSDLNTFKLNSLLDCFVQLKEKKCTNI